MGKSSLCIRTIERLKAQGIATAYLDLQRSGSSSPTPEQWYYSLLAQVGGDVGLRRECLAFYKNNTDFPPVQRFFETLKQVCLTHLAQPLVLFIDEIDMTRSLPFKADEFFVGIRECYTSRATDPALSRLTFCLLGTATPAELIEDARITPFNVGKRIELRDFTPEEAAPLGAHLGTDVLARILYWTGGHPYLTQTLCAAVGGTGKPVDAVVGELFLSHAAREAEVNLTLVRDRLLRADVDQFGLLSLYRQALRGGKVPDDDTNPLCDVLKLSGVVRVERGLLQIRNAIYRRVFDASWVEKHLPGVEVRRQRAAFVRGLSIAGAIALVIIGVVGSLVYFARQETNRANLATIKANDKAEEAERISYIANLNLIQRDWEANNVGHVLDLLEETKPSRFRGFEWGYWNRLCHQDLLTLKGHTHFVSSVAFSPDGKRIVTGSDDARAKVYFSDSANFR